MWKWNIWPRSIYEQANKNNQEAINKEFMVGMDWQEKGKLKTERDCILSCPKPPHPGQVGKERNPEREKGMC